MGNTGQKVCFLGLFVHAAVRGGTCGFTLKNVNTLIKDSSRDDRPSISTYQVEATHGQPGSCRVRPVKIDDGLEDIRWIRGLGSEKLPAPSYAHLSILKKGLFFAIGEGSRIFVRPVFYTAAPKCVCIRRPASARHVSPVGL